uniref:Ataxin-related family protein n=1 Tax=Rhizophora mucronata TaxID=61149 RepID=A0A2P2PJR4_RHIMU
MDEEASLMGLFSEKDVLQPLFRASESYGLKDCLEILIAASRTGDGRSDLASKNNILPAVLDLSRLLPYPSASQYLSLALKLLRNLCAGEIVVQDSFIVLNGVGVVSTILRSVRVGITGPDHGVIRVGLQVLANISLAGEEHQRAIWRQAFPNEFAELAMVRSRETCDPLCMIIYTCVDGSPGLIAELCGDQGLPVVAEIVRTVSVVGFGEDWLKLLLSRICLEESHFFPLFSILFFHHDCQHIEGANLSGSTCFSSEQAYILSILSIILSERIGEITISNGFALCVFGIFKKSAGAIRYDLRGKTGLPTGSAIIDALGYSLTILKDICALDGRIGIEDDLEDTVDTLVSSGLLELLLGLLRELEPPTIIRKALKKNDNQEATVSCSPKLCPYKGFRRDIVAVIGNCAYRRKHVQDEIRKMNWIFLLLQQCVTDEDNPFLREWGIWAVRNILEGNTENQQIVAELEIQGSVDMPEIADLGLRVQVDHNNRRAKLVNVP